MSVRNVLEDQRQPVPGYPTKTWGRYFSLTSSGGNQVVGTPLIPHAYTLRLRDQFEYLTEAETCSTGAKSYYSYVIGYKLARPWSASDDYALYGKLEAMYDKGDFNAAVFAGELGETVDLLADRTKQLAKAVLAAKKGRFLQAAYILGVGGNRKVTSTSHRHRDDAGPQHPQSISNGWLELQYGWKPLLSDIYSLSDQIAKSDKPRSTRIVARQSIPVVWNGSPSFYVPSGGGSYSKQIIAYISEDIPSWPQALGLMDPELVAWEVLPFSFVADWFIPVGNWLQARSFASRAKGMFVTTTRLKCHFRINSGSWANNRSACYFDGRQKTASVGWTKVVEIDRAVSSSLPSVPLPWFSNGIGKGNRLANAVSLVASIFGSKIRLS